MHPLLNIAISAARLAGDLLMRHVEQLDRLIISPKGTNDFFCELDIKAEQLIIQTILKAYPHHGILAEESGYYQDQAEILWIIDPLDGTNNFLHAFPFFCVSIAVCIKDRIEHGVVYDPLRHECFAASRGQGAKLNDRRLRVSKEKQLSKALLGSGYPSHRNARIHHADYESLIHQCAGIRKTGSSALDLAYVASGRLDGFWDFGLKPWDIAAGSLLIQEAGGLVSNLQGKEEFLFQEEIIAGTPKVFKPLLQYLNALGSRKIS